MPEAHDHIKQYTAADIDRYLNRQMSAAEMHALEKAALEDPFLAEAIEGYTDTPAVSATAAIDDLRKRLAEKTGAKVIPMRKKRWWLSAAAVLLLLLGTSSTWYWLRPSTEHAIAQHDVKKNEALPQASESAPVQDQLKARTDTVVIPLIEQPIIAAPDKNKAPAPTSFKPEEENIRVKEEKQNLGQLTRKAPGLESDQAAAPLNYSIKKDAATQEIDGFVSSTEQARGKQQSPGYFPAHIFTGSVTDSNNKPLPFVNISIPNTPTNTYSDANGNFRLLSADSQLVVHVKSFGYKEAEIQLKMTEPSRVIRLQSTGNDLQEMVATSYGLHKKKTVASDEDDKESDEEEPEGIPKDGWGNYDIYLLNNIRLPGTANSNLRGYVELSFFVDRYGRLYDFRVERSSCTSCDKEAIRLVKEGPGWKLSAGEKPTRVVLSIQF